jgi:anaerobic magnesium-protoporphyrin IX monomethyl ester cyclase
MFRRLFSQAIWIVGIVRGEGEEIMFASEKAVQAGRWPADRRRIKGPAFRDSDEIVATEAASTPKDLAAVKPDRRLIDRAAPAKRSRKHKERQ